MAIYFRDFKYPPGLSKGLKVRSNARYADVYPRAPQPRIGIIVAATSKPSEVMIHWEGVKLAKEVHINLFDPL